MVLLDVLERFSIFPNNPVQQYNAGADDLISLYLFKITSKLEKAKPLGFEWEHSFSRGLRKLFWVDGH